MKKTIMLCLLPIFFLIFTGTRAVQAQQLIQSFIEANSVGYSQLGFSVSGVGDVNNDEYADVIIGAIGYFSNTGQAFIYYGGSNMDNRADVTLTGEISGKEFGYSVSGTDDVNADGYDDVIVGTYSGSRAYIYFGSSNMDNVVDVTLAGDGFDRFGFSVSGACDVNNDGYADVIVGAIDYNSSTGRVYIYYGGASMDNTADVVLTGETTTKYFSWSVSGAGDINNDGYDDVIVGEIGYDSFIGRAHLYYGGGSMNNTVDITLTGNKLCHYFGNSVSGAGDVNNDGYADVIVGANGYSSTTGGAFIYYGSSNMDNTADVTLTGAGTYHQFGYSVSGAGDVNNDGYADVIVGTFNSNGAYIYYGGSSMDNIADVTVNGEGTNNLFGCSVSRAGDVNNDGYSDVIVGAPSHTGRAYIYYGGSSMDNIAEVTVNGEGTDNLFGCSVSRAGDVNNDGYADVIIGASNCSDHTGGAYIYYGGDNMDNIVDVTLSGEELSNFGYSVSGAVDVNNDGYSDVIVGAPNAYAGGRAYIYHGGSNMDNTADVTLFLEESGGFLGYTVSGAGDVNNDGYADVIVGAYRNAGRAYIYHGGSNMDNTADVTLSGEEWSNFGYSVSGAGDVNNDGYADVIVGAYYYSNPLGRAYIYFGGNQMDNTADVTLSGAERDRYFGYSVSGVGDVNNDGYADVIIRAYHNASAGRAYIYYGGSNMNNTADVILTGEGTSNQFGYSVSGADDVNNDGYDDVIIGAIDYNSSTGRAYIYYGGYNMDNTADLTLTGEGTSNQFGYSVSGAGDVNNDGYAEVIIGASGYPKNGKAYIYAFDSTSQKIEITSAHVTCEFGLRAPYPNPFNPSVTLSYSLTNDVQTSLKVYNMRGQLVAILVDSYQNGGTYSLNWQPQNLSTGIYIVRLESGNKTNMKKVVFVK